MKFVNKLLLSSLIVLSIVFVPAIINNEKISNYQVQAANITLNKTKKTLYWGEGVTLKVNGTSKKVKWSSSNKKVAYVRDNGRVEAGSKTGTAIITAKVGKKKLTCKITTKPYSKNGVEITELTRLSNTVILKVKNTNSYAVSIRPSAKFYNKNGKKVGTGDTYNFALEPNHECIMKIWNSTVKKSVRVYPNYKTLKLNIGKVERTTGKYHDAKKVEVQSVKKENGNYVVRVKNNSWFTFNFVRATMVYYDKKGNVIAAEGKDVHTHRLFAYGSYEFKFPQKPKDGNKTVKPASYKVFVNYAYRYINN